VPRRHQHPSSSGNRSSDVAVPVDFNTEFNLMIVNPIIECCSMDLIPGYCQCSMSSAIYTAPSFFVDSLHGHPNRSLPCLALHMYAEEIIPTFVMLNIYIDLCLPKPITLTRLRSYEMFDVLVNVRINQSVGIWGILNLRLLRDAFLYWLARGIPLNVGVQSALQSRVRTPPRHLRLAILAFQILINASLPPHPLHCNRQYILQQPGRV